MYFKLKTFFYYLFNDRYWITRKISYVFYKIFYERRFIEIFKKNKLPQLLKLKNLKLSQKEKIFDPILNISKKYNPEIIDLARLYDLIVKNKPFTVLEFGVGYSTIVIAKALYENKKKFNKKYLNEIRNSKMFKVYSVDASNKWIKETKKNLPHFLKEFVKFHQSPVEIKVIDNQICHMYKNIPDINPDFIYLDGPHPLDPIGKINNLSFNCIERTPISADILLLESTLLPGTNILVDGRTNNVRFLKNNLKRHYKYYWDRNGDVTLIKLVEKKLGKINKLGFEFY
jgi:hypothetical protein